MTERWRLILPFIAAILFTLIGLRDDSAFWFVLAAVQIVLGVGWIVRYRRG